MRNIKKIIDKGFARMLDKAWTNRDRVQYDTLMACKYAFDELLDEE